MAVKRTICSFWKEGKCERGSSCGFAHGDHEIGSTAGPPAPGTCAEKRNLCKYWLEGSCERGNRCTWAHGEHELGQQATWAPAPTARSARAAPYHNGPQFHAPRYDAPRRSAGGFSAGGFGAGPMRAPMSIMESLRPAMTPRRTVCKFWLDGNCEKGSMCGFAHGEHEIGTLPGTTVSNNQPTTKRTICKFFEEGHCERGSKCGFAHGEHEIGQPVPNSSKPPVYAGPPSALSSNTTTKRTICKFFEEGHCERGSKCGFAHGEHEIGQVVPGSASGYRQPPPRASPYPMAFLAPVPPLASSQPTSKRTLCKFFQEGHCERGSACGFAHGEHEIGQRLPSAGPVVPAYTPRGLFAPPPSAGATTKRTLCKFHQEGYCERGSACGFAHGEHEIGQAVPGAKPAFASAQTAPETKRTICKFYEEGSCERGSACGFAHGEHEIGQPIVGGEKGRPVRDETKRTLCKFHQEGYCERGTACGFAHGEHEIGQPIGGGEKIVTKRTMCKFFQNGSCERGEKCTFAHFDWELGTTVTEE